MWIRFYARISLCLIVAIQFSDGFSYLTDGPAIFPTLSTSDPMYVVYARKPLKA